MDFTSKYQYCVVWIAILNRLCVAQTPVAFYVERAPVDSGWTLSACNEQPDYAGVTSVDFNQLNMDEACTCFFYRPPNNPWDLNEGITLERYTTSWTTLREYTYEEWNQQENGALRAVIQNRQITLHLNNREDPYNLPLQIDGNYNLRCSNDATISFTSDIPTTTTTSTTTPTSTTTRSSTMTTTTRTTSYSNTFSISPTQHGNESTTANSGPSMLKEDKNNKRLIILVVSLFAAAILVGILVAVVFLITRKQRKQHKDELIVSKDDDIEEDRGSSCHSNLALVAMDTGEDTSGNPLYENTTKPNIPPKPTIVDTNPKINMDINPKISMDTDPERPDDVSASESQTTDDDSSVPGSPAESRPHLSRQPSSYSLHVEDLEFVGKKNKGFRKVKKHKSRKNTILHRDRNKDDNSDAEPKCSNEEDDGAVDNPSVTMVTEPHADNSETAYADIDLKSLATRTPKVDDGYGDAQNITYADVEFS